MKSLKNYIQEKLTINSLQEKLVIKKSKYNYFPKTKEELQDIIEKRIEDEGNEVDLNDIDVSKITDMSNLFEDLDFNGDISAWNVSNVMDMHSMFWGCKKFNQDISSWDVSNVTDMNFMFYGCSKFNQDISIWNVSNVTNMRYMFYACKSFNQDISSWDVSKVTSFRNAFLHCSIEDKYKPKFK